MFGPFPVKRSIPQRVPTGFQLDVLLREPVHRLQSEIIPTLPPIKYKDPKCWSYGQQSTCWRMTEASEVQNMKTDFESSKCHPFSSGEPKELMFKQ